MVRLTALSIAFLIVAGATVQSQELTEKSYDEIRRQILPTAEEELWRQIDWQPTFWHGVIAAQKANKPVLLLAMNGHPFGCT